MFSSTDSDTAHARLERLHELEEFTQTCKKRLENVLKELGWNRYDPASLDLEEEELVKCPFDPGHRVPPRSLKKHKESCLRKKTGYSSEEQKEMPDTSFCYENSSVRTFVMDEATQHQVVSRARSAAPLMKMEGVFWQDCAVSIRAAGQYSGEPVDVPQNHKRALCDLTVADRLALYDHVISELSNQEEPAPSCSNEDLYVDLVKKLQKDEQQKEPKTHLELMAEKRDYKRRRQSYRAKNVHITKKSYTEVIREVINVHTDELSRQWSEEEPEKRRHRERSHERSQRERSHERSQRERSHERSQRERSHERSQRERSHERSQRERSHERSQRERSHERSQRERSHERSQRERSHERSQRERSHERSQRERSHERSQRERSHERSQRERSHERSQRERSQERSRAATNDYFALERNQRERSREQSHERSHERSNREQSQERSREQSRRDRSHRERSHERHRDDEPKKKKKKRQRDSRSPDEHHERKKKKKKRKRDEREEREEK